MDKVFKDLLSNMNKFGFKAPVELFVNDGVKKST